MTYYRLGNIVIALSATKMFTFLQHSPFKSGNIAQNQWHIDHLAKHGDVIGLEEFEALLPKPADFGDELVIAALKKAQNLYKEQTLFG